MQTKAFIVFPHQLFKDIAPLAHADIVFIVEDPLFFSEFKFHKQKLILHRASMRAYFDYLVNNNINVCYIEYTQKIPFTEKSVNHVTWYDPTDNWLNKRTIEKLNSLSIPFNVLESPMFITPEQEFKNFFAERNHLRRKYSMQDFYIWQRKRLNILVTQDKPLGGSWSYDADNRKKLPRDHTIPQTFVRQTSPYINEARDYVEKNFAQNFGETEEFWCPITHADAYKHMCSFVEYRLHDFGPYEDAMTTSSPTVFHSTISPLLNCGLITPHQVIEYTLAYCSQASIPLASLEGFIRQIIGWREYIRALYVLEGNTLRSGNYFNAHNNLPKSLWSGTTHIEPIDHHVHILSKFAYTHHIPRLMIFGNFMNLCGIEPHQAYHWFMEMYIDAYDWVMVANVYSMALYADGGLITTKPYIAGSNYILKMSYFKRGEWCTTIDTLFWNFIDTHHTKLATEGRLGFIEANYKKIPHERLVELRKSAHTILKGLECLPL